MVAAQNGHLGNEAFTSLPQRQHGEGGGASWIGSEKTRQKASTDMDPPPVPYPNCAAAAPVVPVPMPFRADKPKLTG